MLLFQCTSVSKAYFLNEDCAQLERMLGPKAPMGPRRQGAISTHDLARFKQAFSRPGCATAALQYYQARVSYVLHALSGRPGSRERDTVFATKSCLPCKLL